MRLFTLETEQRFPQSPETLFRFFTDAANLEQLTPPWLHFRILSQSGALREGTKIRYRLRLHGIPLRWQSEITAWEPPFRFVDTQIRGPYRAWTHEHVFEYRDGATVMRDRVQYGVIGGSIIQKFLVAPDLSKIFEFRRVRLASIFGESNDG
jgi:ligand-binding SRPBCC domain-containing protein